MSRIYALANQKGGVGKTTTAVNLAACLAEAGERALVIDLDPQANATSGLGMRANGTSSYDLLDGAPLAELVHPTAFANLDLVPAKPDLAGAVVELSGRSDGERYLAQALASGQRPLRLRLPRLPAVARAAHGQRARRVRPRARAGAGGVLRARRPDAAPALGRADPAAAQPEPRHRRRCCSRWSTAARASRIRSRRKCGGTSATLVFRTSVPRSVRLAEAPSHGLPAIAYDRRSAGADAYWKVAMELVERA